MYPRKLNNNELVDGLIAQCAAVSRFDFTGIPIMHPALYYLFIRDGKLCYKGTNVDNSNTVTRQEFLKLINELPDSFATIAPLNVWYETEITARLNIQFQRNNKLEEIGI